MTAGQFARLASKYSDMGPAIRRAVDSLAIGDGRGADSIAPRGSDDRRAADRFILELDAAGCPIGPARPTAARCVPMFAD
jgi:hypothetical protein